jgi:hypothetical protein
MPEGFFLIFGIIILGVVIYSCIKHIIIHNIKIDGLNNV